MKNKQDPIDREGEEEENRYSLHWTKGFWHGNMDLMEQSVENQIKKHMKNNYILKQTKQLPSMHTTFNQFWSI